mgnify:CR=1 FL=1
MRYPSPSHTLSLTSQHIHHNNNHNNSGLDPETRRKIWDVLLQVRHDKCMILTTHSMEEADVLTTRVAIMSQGRYEDRFSLCVGVVMWCGVCCEVVWGVWCMVWGVLWYDG